MTDLNKSGLSRRTLAKGAAWTAPAIAIAAAAPMASASPVPLDCVATSFSGTSCKEPGSKNGWAYNLSVCFQNTCQPKTAPITINVTRLTNNAGKAFHPAVNETIVIGPGERFCTATKRYTSSSSASTIFIYGTINGGTDQLIAKLPAPPDCTNTTTSSTTLKVPTTTSTTVKPAAEARTAQVETSTTTKAAKASAKPTESAKASAKPSASATAKESKAAKASATPSASATTEG